MSKISKVCIYGMEKHGVLNQINDGFKNIGIKTIWRRHDVFNEDCVEDFDLVVCNGLRNKYHDILKCYNKINTPVMVTDLGYLNRKEGYYQVGLNKLGYILPQECPNDRFKKLNIVVSQKRKKSDNILLLGQLPGDAQHGFTEFELINLYKDYVQKLRSVTKRKIIFRPHPVKKIHLGDIVDGYDNEQTLNFNNIHAAVTYNSTSGLDALIAGVPVFCDESAFYVNEGNSDFRDLENPNFPIKSSLEKLLNRVAYSQWTRDEISKGLPMELLLKLLNNDELFNLEQGELLEDEKSSSSDNVQ